MMFKGLLRNYAYPIAVFSGGIIGVGFLSLPYVTKQSGIWTVLFYFVLLVSVVILLNRIFAEISLKTPDYKRFPGFAKHHLGKWGGIIALACTVVSSMGVLLVYLLVGSSFLSKILSSAFGGSQLFYTLLYFVAGSTIVFLGIKIIARVEVWILAFFFLSLFFIFIKGFSQIKLLNIFPQGGIPLSGANLFLPYGAILFSLWGMGLIPEIEEMLVGKKKLLKTAVTASVIIISVVYILFVLLVLGITGSATTPTALPGLENVLDSGLVVLALFVGFLATFTAFITQGITLKKVLMYDLRIKHWQAFVMACFTPLVLLLAGLNSFIGIVSFLGGILFGVFGIMTLLMYKKIGGKMIIICPLSFVFILGIIYQIIYFIK